jgi:hypothetical protein
MIGPYMHVPTKLRFIRRSISAETTWPKFLGWTFSPQPLGNIDPFLTDEHAWRLIQESRRPQTPSNSATKGWSTALYWVFPVWIVGGAMIAIYAMSQM